MKFSLGISNFLEDFGFGAPKSLQMVIAATELKDTKRWQEYMEELYKKYLHDPDNHDDVITNLEPDILECEVKWALEGITTARHIYLVNALSPSR